MRNKRAVYCYLIVVVVLVALVVSGAILLKSYSHKTAEQAEENVSEIEFVTEAETVNEKGAESASEVENGAFSEESVSEMETETVEETDGETELLFVGDVLICEETSEKYSAKGISGVLDDSLAELLNNADITMANEEFPFSTKGEPMEDKQYTFEGDPKQVTALLDMGVDVVSLANNHTLDFGDEAMLETFSVLDEAGISYVGAGEDLDRACELILLERNGKTFGFLAASRVIPVTDWNILFHTPGMLCTYDDTLLLEQIEAADALCDVLTVYVHWGVEYQEYPEDYQRTLAQHYVDAGADLIIGSHPHCLQGIEYVDGVPVFYSLGNFVFGKYMAKTMAVQVKVDEENQLSCRIIGASTNEYHTQQMDQTQQENLSAYIQSISYGNVTVTEDGWVLENRY
ncbi:MAG: CapA family protein [Roseburia sp.]